MVQPIHPFLSLALSRSAAAAPAQDISGPLRSSSSSVRPRGLLPRRRRRALAESVLEAARHGLEVLHAAGAWGAAALGLLRPLVGPHLRGRVTAGATALLLEVEGSLAATHAEAVGLLVALAHGRRAVAAPGQPRHHMQS